MDTFNNIFDVDNDTQKPPTDGPEYEEDLVIRKLQGRWSNDEVKWWFTHNGAINRTVRLVYDFHRRKKLACCRYNKESYDMFLDDLRIAKWYEHELVEFLEQDHDFTVAYEGAIPELLELREII